MVKVLNSSDSDSCVMIDGAEYVALAGEESREISREVAEKWLRSHSFLQIVEGESVEAPEPEKAPEDAPEGAEEAPEASEEKEESEEEDEDVVDLDGLSRDELDELAGERDLDASSFRTKADIIAALKEAE